MCFPPCPSLAKRTLAIAFLVIAAHGCARQPADQPVEHTVRKIPTDTSDQPQQTRAEFEGLLKASLERLEEEVRELKTKADTLEQSAKAKWAEEMAELDAKQKAAREKLDEVTKSAGEAWKSLRNGTKNAWEEFEQAIKKAREKI